MHLCTLLLATLVGAQALKLRTPRVLASALIGTLINVPIDFQPLLAIHNPLVQVAHADFRAAQKRTYFRMVPKIITGRDFYKGELKQAIDKEDWKVVEKAFEVYVAKVNPNDPSQIDQTDRYVDNYFLRPMTVFAGSFAERATSPKTRDMMQQVELFRTALNDLEGCVKDRQEGFFSPVIKAPQGAQRKKQVGRFLPPWQSTHNGDVGTRSLEPREDCSQRLHSHRRRWVDARTEQDRPYLVGIRQ